MLPISFNALWLENAFGVASFSALAAIQRFRITQIVVEFCIGPISLPALASFAPFVNCMVIVI